MKTRDAGDDDVTSTFAFVRAFPLCSSFFYITVCNYGYVVVVVVVVLFDSTLCDVFSSLDATRRVVVVVLRRRRLRRRRCHQKHAIPWCDCPLGSSPNGPYTFYLYCTRVVNIVVVDTRKNVHTVV